MEVTELGPSDELSRASNLMSVFHEPLAAHEGLTFRGVLERIVEEPVANDLRGRINRTAQRSARTRQLRELIIPGTLKFCVAPVSQEGAVRAWGEKNSVQGILGPPITSDDLKRIKRKVREKAKQLPAEGAGLLVVRLSPLAGWREGVAQVMDELESELSARPNLLGLVVVHGGVMSEIAASDFSIISGPRFLIRRKSYLGNDEQVLCVLNSYSPHRVSVSTVARLLHAFARPKTQL